MKNLLCLLLLLVIIVETGIGQQWQEQDLIQAVATMQVKNTFDAQLDAFSVNKYESQSRDRSLKKLN